VKVIRIVKVAFQNIAHNKLRSILTMIGLIIGIASVIILVGISNGTNQNVSSEVQSLGTDVLTVSITSSGTAAYNLDYTDMKDIAKLDNAASVSPYKNVNATVNRGTTQANNSSITATDEYYLDIRNMGLASGRKISIIDIENNSKVCIIGDTIASTLFGLAAPLGQTIGLNGDNYTVIGVLAAQGTSMGTNADNQILIPITTAKYLGVDTKITSLYVKVKDQSIIGGTESVIGNYLMSKNIPSDYYTVSSQTNAINTMNNINNTLTALLVGVASISLVVGGIGVMNVMLVSVTERTKEIGIRKSLGARKMDILFQFLVEALVLSILGGIIGIGAGILLGSLSSMLNYTFMPTQNSIIISFSSSAAIGIVFGIFPAYRAAGLNPIDALRQE